MAIQTDESLKSQSAVLGSIFLYHTESNNNNHKKKQIHNTCAMKLIWVEQTEKHTKHHPTWITFGVCVFCWRILKGWLPVFVLARWSWPEYGRIWFSGKLQSFSSLSQWILSNARIITEILWVNFSNHKCMAWPFFAHNMPFSGVQLHSLFKPNNLDRKINRKINGQIRTKLFWHETY